MRKGRTFVVSGPSGVGKSTVLKALLESRKNLYFSVSATTRDPRPGELDGIHYHFMDVESFRKWIAMDQFLEYAELLRHTQEVCGRCHGGREGRDPGY